MTHTRFTELPWKWFVWVEGMQGPTPQAWGMDYLPVDSADKPKDKVLAKHEMTREDQGLSLDQLAEKYPYAER